MGLLSRLKQAVSKLFSKLVPKHRKKKQVQKKAKREISKKEAKDLECKKLLEIIENSKYYSGDWEIVKGYIDYLAELVHKYNSLCGGNYCLLVKGRTIIRVETHGIEKRGNSKHTHNIETDFEAEGEVIICTDLLGADKVYESARDYAIYQLANEHPIVMRASSVRESEEVEVTVVDCGECPAPKARWDITYQLKYSKEGSARTYNYELEVDL